MTTTSTPALVGDRTARVSAARARIGDAVSDAYSRESWTHASFRPGNLVTASGSRSLNLGIGLLAFTTLGVLALCKMGAQLNGPLVWLLAMVLLAAFVSGFNFMAKGEHVIQYEMTRVLHDQYDKAVLDARKHARRHPGSQGILRDINATKFGFTELLYQLEVAIPAACRPGSDFLTEEDEVSAREKLGDPESIQDDAADVLAQVVVACWDVKRLAASPGAGVRPTKPAKAPRQRDASLQQMRDALERIAQAST